MATLWAYASEGGATFVATDGHTEIVRRSGTHRTMPLYEIAKLAPFAVDEQGNAVEKPGVTPPTWDQVLKAGAPGKVAKAYGMSPDYFARVGDIERAAGARAGDDFTPPTGMSAKHAKQQKANLKNAAFATWTIPSDNLGGWFFRLETTAALWEGIIMPRRV